MAVPNLGWIIRFRILLWFAGGSLLYLLSGFFGIFQTEDRKKDKKKKEWQTTTARGLLT
jgi:hypothetical protein